MKEFNLHKNTFYSYLYTIINICIGLYSIPLAIEYFGKENYGIYLLAMSIISYLSLIKLGIPTASATLITQNNDNLYKKKIVCDSIVMLILISTVASSCLFIMNLLIPNWIEIFGDFSSEKQFFLAKNVFLIVIVGFLIRIPFLFSIEIFSAFQKMYIAKIFELGMILVNFLILIYAVYNKWDLAEFVLYIAILNLLLTFLATLYLFYLLKNYKIKNKNSQYKKILSSSSSFFFIGIASTIIWSTDSLVISNLLGFENVTLYSTTLSLFSIGFVFFTVMNGILFPVFGRLYANQDYKVIQNIFDASLIFIPFIAFFIWLGGVLFGKEIILLWLNDESLYGGILFFYIFGSYGYLLSIVNIHGNLLGALNLVKNNVKIAWLEAIINLGLSILLGKLFGLIGIILGTLFGVLLAPFIFLPRYVNINTNNKIQSNLIKHIIWFFISSCFIGLISLFIEYNNPSFLSKVVMFVIIFIFLVYYQKDKLFELKRIMHA